MPCAEIDLAHDPLARRGCGRVGGDASAHFFVRGLGRGAAGLQAHRDELHSLGRLAVAVDALMLGTEALSQCVQVVGGEHARGHVEHELMRLADIVQGRAACQPQGPVCDQLGARLGGQLVVGGVDALHRRLVERRHREQVGARIVVLNVGHQQAESAEQAGAGGHDHPREAHCTRKLGGVQRTGAAEGDKRVVARIAAALHRDRAHCADDVRCPDRIDSVRRIFDRETQRHAHLVVDRLFRLGTHDVLGAAGDDMRIQEAEHGVGVGDGRLAAAQVVAGRTGRGAGAARPDLEQAAGVDVGDAAAARADFGDVDRGDAQHLPTFPTRLAALAHAAADVVLERLEPAAVLDQRCLGGGAAHVEGDEIPVAGLARQVGAGEYARRRPRFDDVHRPSARRRGRHDPAVGLHDQNLAAIAELLESALQPTQVALHDRHQIGIDRGRAAALVLADLAQHVGRHADDETGCFGRDDVANRALVCRVRIGVEQAHRERVDPLGGERAQLGPDLRSVEDPDRLAVGGHALVDLAAQMARHQARRFLPGQVEDVALPAAAADFQHVAEAARGDQADPGAGTFEHRVGCDRRAMNELDNVRGDEAMLCEHLLHRIDDATGVVVGRGEHLGPQHPAVVGDDDQVGEGAAGIYTDA